MRLTAIPDANQLSTDQLLEILDSGSKNENTGGASLLAASPANLSPDWIVRTGFSARQSAKGSENLTNSPRIIEETASGTYATVPNLVLKGEEGICISDVHTSTAIWSARRGKEGSWIVQRLFDIPFRDVMSFAVDLSRKRLFLIREDDHNCYLGTSSGQTALPLKGDFLSLSPDGRFLAIGSSDLPYPKRSIQVYELAAASLGHKIRDVIFYGSTGKVGLAGEFVWSPNSEELAYAEAIPWSGVLWTKARLVALHVLNGKKRILYQNIYPIHLYAWSSQNPVAAELKKL